MTTGYATVDGQSRRIDTKEIRGKHGGIFTRVYFRILKNGAWETREHDYPPVQKDLAERATKTFLGTYE